LRLLPPAAHRTRVRGTGPLREILPYYRWGVGAGLLGAFAVAVFFLALDLAAGRPLATPNALGSALFLGIPFDLAQPLRAIVILGYTAVHGALFVGLALVVSALVLGSRRAPPSAPMLALILVGAFFAALTVLFGCFSLLSPTLSMGLQTPLVLLANLFAATAMALLLSVAFQTRWRRESALAPVQSRDSASPRREPVGIPTARDRRGRESRLDAEWLHLFSLKQFVRELRNDHEYADQGRAGMILLKTDRLRVVLEAAAEGTAIGEHTVPGAAVVHVLEGEIDLVCMDTTRAAHAGELVVIPHDRPRSILAKSDAIFLWTLAIEHAA